MPRVLSKPKCSKEKFLVFKMLPFSILSPIITTKLLLLSPIITQYYFIMANEKCDYYHQRFSRYILLYK